MMHASKITGVGAYLPSQIVTNDDLSKLMDTSDEWIQKRTGIKQRRWVEEECTSDLALEATKKALESAGVDKSELDMIIFATLSPDHDFPGSACFLQAKLGIEPIALLDVRQQCTGFIYALSVADQYIKTGMYQKILVVGAEVHSTGLDKTTKGRDVSVLFGDGAGAVVIEATQIPGGSSDAQVFSTHLWADGNFAKELWAPGPGSNLSGGSGRERLSQAHFDEGLHYAHMNGKKVFTHAIKRMCESIHLALAANDKTLEDVDLFLFHQANLRINQTVANQLKIPEEKVFNTIENYGNTTAATLPIGMNDAVKAGKLKPGMLVALSAFGSGFTWASALLRW